MEMPTLQGALESNYSGGAPARLQQDVTKLAPLATTFVSQAPNVYAPGTTVNQSYGGVIGTAAHFIGGLFHETGSLSVAAAKWVGTQGLHFGEGAVNIPKTIYNYGAGAIDSYTLNNQANNLDIKQKNLDQQYKSGSINSQQYTSGLKDIMKSRNDLTSQLTENNKRLQDAKSQSASALGTITTVMAAVLTDGLSIAGGEGAAARYLVSTNANAYLDATEKAISKVVLNKELFSQLTPLAQKAIQEGVATAVSTATKSTGQQIARTAATGMVLKYPILYNWLSGSGKQIYKELQQKKYGAAIQTIALNAAIAVGGGILGETARSAAGKGSRAVVGSMFSRSNFMDTLSKNLFGDEAALFNAAKGNPERIKALSDLEHTHMSATAHDPVAAAWRVINGERSVDGLNASEKGATAWLDHNIAWARNSKLASQTAEKYGLGPVSVGRWTANTARMVQDTISKSTTIEGRLQAWEALKQEFKDSAFANSDNLDTQVKTMIKEGRHESINTIKAGRFLTGFPEAEARKMASEGFLPINGAKHAASFTEGTGTLTSKFANGEDLFTKAVAPLPVLGSIGAMFTKMGLSPYASTEQVSTLYNANLAKNIRNTSLVNKVTKFLNEKGLSDKPTPQFTKAELSAAKKQGVTPEMLAKGTVSGGEAAVKESAPISKTEADGADYIRKSLSSYANKPTRKGLESARIVDERQMTLKDITLALSNKGITISRAEAADLQSAISKAHIDIPTAIKGLGDRAIDVLYRTPGVASVERRFLRLQGSLRFTYNPFFQYLRAVPKLEILSESEGGGFVKSIFSGRLTQMRDVREGLRAQGFLNETARLGSATTEESLITTERNLVKQLMPAQENSIAGLVDSLSQKAGMPWQDYVAQNPEHVRDLIQSIAEYSRKSDFLNSPLARTLNIAIFPFRFDTKVLTIMTKSLSRQDYLVRTGFIQGLVQGHNFLNSAQGQAWYQHNAEAIGMFKYITPFANFNEIFHALQPGNDHSLGNFGELGGLPFGWIPQMLDAEGLTQFNQPGADPKTGVLYTKYIPASTKGQMAIAIQDLLGSMFSYPGATAGLPSKGQLTQKAALGLVMGSKKRDLQPQTPQGQMIDGILNGPPQTAPLQTQTAPAQPTTAGQPKFKTPGVPKKKKSQYTPALLPGQSSLGQL